MYDLQAARLALLIHFAFRNSEQSRNIVQLQKSFFSHREESSPRETLGQLSRDWASHVTDREEEIGGGISARISEG